MPTISQLGTRVRRLRPGPPIDRDAGDSSPRTDVQPGRGPDLREPRVQPGRGPDLRGDLDTEAAEPRTLNRLRPGPPKDREVENTRRQFGPVAQPAAELEPARPESVGQRKNFQVASQEFARFLRQNSEAFAQAVEALGDGDASGFAQAWLEDYDRRAEETIDRVAPELRPLFSTDLEAHRAEFYNEAYAVERDHGILAIRQGITSTRQEYLKLVGQEPARLDYAFQKMEEMIRASGLRPDLIEEEVHAARRAIFTSYRQARLAGPNPEALLREMEAGHFEGVVPPEEMEALVVQTTAEVGQRQRAALMERQVDADTRQRLELQRLRAGEGGDPHITPDALREIFPGEVGERKARLLEEELAVAEKFNELANAPAETRREAAEAAGGRNGVAEVVADDVPAAEDSAERTVNREAASTGPRSERDEAPSEGELTRAPGLESDSGVDPDTLAQLTQEERDQVIGRERGPDFQGERPQDPVRGVAAPPDSEAANAVRRAVAEIERSLENDSKQHLRVHDKDIREIDAKAEAARTYANRPDLSPEERRQAREAAALATQHAVGVSDALQTEIKGTDIGNRVLTKPDAAEKARELASLDFDRQVAWWRDIDEYYGPFAGRVLNEIAAVELNRDQSGIALLVLSGASQAFIDAWSRAAGKSLDELREEVGDPQRIESNMVLYASSFLETFAEGGREQEGLARLDMATRLALLLVAEGRISNPLSKALRAFFPFERVTDSLLISPDVLKTFDDLDRASGIERFLDGKQDDLEASELSLAAAGIINDQSPFLRLQDKKEFYADHVRAHGRWRNTCDGVQLVDGDGRPVKHADGSFVAFTWEEIKEGMEMEKEKEKERVRKGASARSAAARRMRDNDKATQIESSKGRAQIGRGKFIRGASNTQSTASRQEKPPERNGGQGEQGTQQ